MKKFYLIAFFALLLGCSSNPKVIQCTLKGEVIDRPYSSELVLLKLNEDPRTEGPRIPIRDGKFEYVLQCGYEEMYQLIFLDELQKGSIRLIYFLSEKGTVNFTLYPKDEAEKNRIEGGALNTEYYALEKSISEIMTPLYAKQDQLIEEGKYYSAEAAEIDKKFDTAKGDERSKLIVAWNKLREEGRYFSPEMQVWEEEYTRANQLCKDMRWKHAKEHPGIVGYSIVVDAAWRATQSRLSSPEDSTFVAEMYNTVYAKKYPNHPYTEQMEILVNDMATIKVGGHYIDFEAPDLQGNNVKLSEQIQGKIAVVHLWSVWCSPCRMTGKELIPVYEAYKDKGFTVVGVANRTGSDIDAIKAAVEKDKYPWLNLVEVDDKAKIWIKYGIGNAGGEEVLIDENGVILAISPTVKEVEKILSERLK